MSLLMRALVKEGSSVTLARVPRPAIRAPEDVLIRVVRAGLCRTDVYVAQNLLASRDPVILGHELSGVVEETGSAVQHVAPGDRVSVMPLLSCGGCPSCRAALPQRCSRAKMLGVEENGAFAEYLLAPARAVYRLPANLPWEWGAYAEPVAASLAVLQAEIHPAQRGLVYGSGRIAELTWRILRAKGFLSVEQGEAKEEDAWDFIIETRVSEEAMADMIRALRPGGLLVLKSRQVRPVLMDLRRAVQKELRFVATHYGRFEEAIALLAEGKLEVSDLLGGCYPLSAYRELFADSSETKKVFFDPFLDR